MEIILAIGLSVLVGCVLGAIAGECGVGDTDLTKKLEKMRQATLANKQEEARRKEQLAIMKRIERAETLHKQHKFEEAEKEYREVYSLVYDHSKR